MGEQADDRGEWVNRQSGTGERVYAYIINTFYFQNGFSLLKWTGHLCLHTICTCKKWIIEIHFENRRCLLLIFFCLVKWKFRYSNKLWGLEWNVSIDSMNIKVALTLNTAATKLETNVT